MIMHLKHCRVQEIVEETTQMYSIVADEFDFMIDGCLSHFDFVQNNFGKFGC